MTGPVITAIVLAGGRSSRFGRDKLAEPIDGRPLLHHAIEAVRLVARDIVVVAAPGSLLDVPPGVRVVHDAVAFDGPLAGLLTGLHATTAPVVLVTAGDMPHLAPDVIDALRRALDAPTIEAAVIEQAGRPRPLPMALRRKPAQAAVTRLLAAGERRLRALPQALSTTVIPETVWRALDPAGLTTHDIDTPDDLP